jgi:FKBP-type peptidyl-prolyl cis-trans isomerase (trigger factor)
MDKKLIGIGGAIVVAIILIGVAFVAGRGTPAQGDAVAIVNNETITRQAFNEQFQQVSAAYEAQGIDMSAEEIRTAVEQEVLDGMINEKLLLQRARQEGITATEEDIEEQLQLIAGQFPDEESFRQQIAEFGMTEEELREVIARQVVIQAYVERHIAAQNIEVTEEEVAGAYDEYSELVEDAPPLEDIRPDITAELVQQKEQEIVLAFLEQLKAESDIQILL